MANVLTKKRPIDAFKEYFMEVKPYHAKILEIVEKYNFHDDLVVNIADNAIYDYNLANTPLCQGVGFGLDWDDCCGYDAIECCTLGTCPVNDASFDNTSPTFQAPIKSITANSGIIDISGNHSYDMTFPIKNIINQSTFNIAGNVVNYFVSQPTFMIVPYTTIPYTINGVNSIVVDGNYAQQFVDKRDFRIQGSRTNDGHYHVASAIFSQSTQRTTVVTVEPLTPTDAGNILLQSSTRNYGAYSLANINYDGANTIVTIVNNGRNLVTSETPTSVLFKSGFIQGRLIEVQNNNPANNGRYVIVDSTYDNSTDTTSLSVTNTLGIDTGSMGTVTLMTKLNISDYLADLNCDNPKENNVSVNFGERLVIRGGFRPSPTPTPTQSITPSLHASPTPTPAPSPTRTPAPSVTPTPSRTRTPIVSPSLTPSLTPSKTVTPTPPVSVSQSVTPSVTVTPSRTPTPAALTRTPTPTPAPSPTRTPAPSVTPTPSKQLRYDWQFVTSNFLGQPCNTSPSDCIGRGPPDDPPCDAAHLGFQIRCYDCDGSDNMTEFIWECQSF